MKKTLLIIFTLFCAIQIAGRDNHQVVSIEHKGGDHFGSPIYPADQPDVYFDDVDLEIIIDGTGEATYYDVDIISMSTLVTLISTQVNGTYDTIDVSSLPDDNYKIVITSSNYNVFEGYFTNY